MEISRADWSEYVRKLSAIDSKAASLMEEYIASHGYDDPDALVKYAHALATKYGEASGALACEMYDEVAAAQGALVPPAVPAETATYGETAKAIRGTWNVSPDSVPATTGRLVKQVGADTILKNAERDGAQFAWVPSGDTCIFCMTLASNGWQYMSKNALKNGHAEHIHANCDCTYAVRFDGKSGVKGYDPDKYKKMYDEAEGSTPQEKINSMRREQYAENKDRINEQKRMRYAERKTEKIVVKAAQEDSGKIPAFLEGKFEGFEKLMLSEDERNCLLNLFDRTQKDGFEFGEIFYDGGRTGTFTSSSPDKILMEKPIDGKELKMYHSHTNDTPHSSTDLSQLLDERVKEVGVVTRNGDAFIVEVGNGYRPSIEVFQELQSSIIELAEQNVKNMPEFWDMTPEERSYCFIREKAYCTAHEFDWTIRGGKINE